MHLTTRDILKFVPLALFFVGFAFLVNDMKTPAVVDDRCTVLATGEAVTKQKITGTSIYRQSESITNDVALDCQKLGMLTLNDTQLSGTAITKGQSAQVTRKRYRILPERWGVSVITGKPKEDSSEPPQ